MSGIAAASGLSPIADPEPMIVNNLTGNLRIQQPIPKVDDVDLTTPVIGGRIEITPAEGVNVPGGKVFALTKVAVSFAGFSIHRSYLTIDRTRTYTEVGVQLARAVTFTALSAGPDVFAVNIPKDDFLLYTSAVVNGDLETSYKQPMENVTGTIDFAHGTVTMHVVLGTKVKFKEGCADLCQPVTSCEVCVVDETTEGTLTADLAGTIVFPDADGDGVPDRNDNCRFVPNPTQTPVATPIITAPAAITVASCADHHIGNAAATDICDAGPLTVTNNAPATFLVGSNLVTWKAQDEKGRFATATQNVTVVDTTSPIITSVPPDIALNDCKAVDLGLPTATDDCAGTPTFTNNAPPKFLVGTTVVTWTATDASGNHDTATQTVTVVDTVPPTVACVPLNGGFFQVSVIDACTATPSIRLGTFALTNGEQINITETGQAGIRLVNVMGPGNIRHFHVGRGEAIITATDESGNVASAMCR
jgi:hypothetical protein